VIPSLALGVLNDYHPTYLAARHLVIKNIECV
jgi:hypothetical protein